MAALAIRLRRRAALLGRLVPFAAADAVRLGITVVVAFFLSMALELDTPEWAAWTVLSVSLSTRASSLQKSLWRAVGSVAGAVVAVLMVGALAQSVLALDAAVAGWTALAALLSSVERGQRSYGFALMGFTVPIVVLGVAMQPDRVFAVAVDRCSTILLGIGCAHVSSVMVARGTRRVGRELAEAMERTDAACAAWIERAGRSAAALPGSDPGPPPVQAVLALDELIFGGLVEQSSLRTGGRFVARATRRLLFRMAAAAAAAMLPEPREARDRVRRAGLLLDLPGSNNDEAFRRRRLAVVARLLREQRRIGRARAPARALAVDRDWIQARNNAVRALAATGSVEAFAFASGWASGAAAATWTAVLSTLLAARADAADVARDFVLGAALASVVGIPLHYLVLDAPGQFGLLAAVVFPLAFLAALGRQEAGAVTAAGFGFLIFNVMSIHDRMTYDLGADLDGAVAELAGMAVAVAAFRALPPPATAERRARRAQRRMARAVRLAAVLPRPLLPDANWLPPMFRRLAAIADVPDAGPGILRGGWALLVAGQAILALRRHDDGDGRAAGRWFLFGNRDAPPAPRRDADGLAGERMRLIAACRAEPGLTRWPGLPQKARR